MSSRGRVLVAMSGGVDSSVAAGLLCEQGYDVIGVFMRLGAAPEAEACDASALALSVVGAGSDRRRGCCSASDATDARAVAGRLGIPFYALNFEQDFARLKQYFADEYAAARTPNPCVKCNQWLKFGHLVNYADALGAELIATGHYARVREENGRRRLYRAADAVKDQSYVLFGVAPAILRRTLFPLGGLNKAEVRAEARRLGLRVHDKAESQDICFVPDGQYADVVRSRRPDAQVRGEIRHVDGRVLGRHDGIDEYTIGQRRGLGVAADRAMYVVRLDAESGEVTIGPREAVYRSTATASDVRWIAERPDGPIRAAVRIRYHHEAAPGWVFPRAADAVEVRFDEPQWAVTPGQALVMYREDEVLGGGWIDGPARQGLGAAMASASAVEAGGGAAM